METISYKKIELLPDHLKKEVNDFIDFLLLKEKKAKKLVSKKKELTNFSGIITEEEAIEWKKSIAECRKIDLNEW
jgi:hypothetical protein